jgi:hypothetical protein
MLRVIYPTIPLINYVSKLVADLDLFRRNVLAVSSSCIEQ